MAQACDSRAGGFCRTEDDGSTSGRREEEKARGEVAGQCESRSLEATIGE